MLYCLRTNDSSRTPARLEPDTISPTCLMSFRIGVLFSHSERATNRSNPRAEAAWTIFVARIVPMPLRCH